VRREYATAAEDTNKMAKIKAFRPAPGRLLHIIGRVEADGASAVEGVQSDIQGAHHPDIGEDHAQDGENGNRRVP